MKTSHIALSTLLLLASTGCSKEDMGLIDNNQDCSATFTAFTESYNPQTKTSRDAEGNVLWKKGDQVSIFAGRTINEQYQVTDASDGKTSASLNRVVSPGLATGSNISANISYYPYSESNKIAVSGNNYSLTISLPSVQYYADNSFGNGAFPMVAVTNSESDMNLKFKNVLGGLKLQLKGTDKIKRITVTGNNNEKLCGTAQVSAGNNVYPTITLSDATMKMVSLDCGNGVQLNSETPTSFIIALPPITMSDGFTIDIYNTNGEIQQIKSTKSQTITRSALLAMPAITVACEPVISCESLPLTFEAIKAGAQISFIQSSWIDFGTNVEYSTDGNSWLTYTSGTTITLENVGNKVMFRGSLSAYSPESVTSGNVNLMSRFTTTADCYVYGNIMSLSNPFDFASATTINESCSFCGLFYGNTHIKNHVNKSIALPATTLTPYCYYEMFHGCTGITSAPQLPATTLSDGCYSEMFYGCTSLAFAPELPATTLASECYREMFAKCTSLTSGPELPATTLSDICYAYMFSGCSSLVSVPELPATTLKNSCYMGMFEFCSQLIYSPELPATKLNVSCYEEMFKGCTSLVSAPELPATTLSSGCYLAMFDGCKKLVSAPELSASTVKSACYGRMFRGCTSLTTAPELPATTLGEECYYEMFYGCKNLENVPQSLPALTLKNACYQGMFLGCTGLTSAPQLPATAMVQNCYYRMFYNCSNLNLAPVLAATELKNSCYYQMFANCSNLDMITCLATDISATNCTKGWLSGVKESGTFVKATDMEDWDRNENGIPSDWTVASL